MDTVPRHLRHSAGMVGRAALLLLPLLAVAQCLATPPTALWVYGVDLKDLPVSQCIEALRKKTEASDPDGTGANVVVLLPEKIAAKRISLKVTKVSWLAAYEKLCTEAGAVLTLDGDTLVISERRADFSQYNAVFARKENGNIRYHMSYLVFPMWKTDGKRSVAAAIKELNRFSVELDPEGEGIPMVLDMPAEISSRAAEAVYLENTPLLAILRYFVYMNGLEVEIKGKAIVLRPLGASKAAGEAE